MPSIIDLPKIVHNLEKPDQGLFQRFFDIHLSTGKLVLPESNKAWAKKTFGSLKNVEEQRILKVLDKNIFEAALFNELRSKRPKPVKQEIDFKKILEESRNGPFSRPLSSTPADTWGRVKGKYCVSASNVAKYDGTHGLIIFKKHNPLDFTEKELQDYFSTAMKWFGKAHKDNRKALYPYLLWNSLWRAAASIIHGHMQTVLGESFHYADAENMNRVRNAYAVKYDSLYFEDLFEVHKLIGLGFDNKGVKVFTNIVPREDKEVTLVSKKLDRNCVRAIHKVLKCLINEFGVMSFNLGVVFPPLEKDEEWDGFPVIVRVVDRGKLAEKTVDVGGMEIYDMGNVIQTDPYKVFKKVKSYFKS